jgi:poly-gamma-glutamate synthesis protein (capsule biosynthesis protein)
MCGDSFYNLGYGVASSLSKYGKDFLQTDIVNFFLEHDSVLCNIECVLSNTGRKGHILRSVHMRGRPEAARYVAEWGLKVANLANNHILEQGLEAAKDTVRHLEQVGIKTIGAGENGFFQNRLQVVDVMCKDHTLTFIGMCLRDEKYAFNGGVELKEIIDTIETLTRQNRIICISVHWGDELMDRPSIRQKQIARTLIDAGATLIIGHHPHVVQGVERYKGGLIAYSLGNFIFDSFLSDCCWSMILSLELTGKEVLRWHYVPIEKGAQHRPIMVHGSRKNDIEGEIRRRCELLKNEVPELEYQKQYESDFKARDGQARRQLWQHLCKKSWRINPVYWPQILLRPIQRRLGKW